MNAIDIDTATATDSHASGAVRRPAVPVTGGVRPITIAILAMGGEGGGVLADWIVSLGEHNGHLAQSTSVAGVAQRTGATIYYLELFARAEAERVGAEPVLALMPTPGDVDVLIASELMEAGRAVQRGLVTPDRTTLIASTHRVYSIAEKSAMGNGIVDGQVLLDACGAASARFIGFDMADIVAHEGSVISAVLFGALCGAGVLPFDRAQFEATIERGGVGVAASLRAFAAGCARAVAGEAPALSKPDVPAPGAASRHGPAAVGAIASGTAAPAGASHHHPAVAALLQRLANDFPAPARPLLHEGVRRLVDYQDPAYAAEYLDRMDAVARHGQPELTAEVGRHLALWMSYEDTIRVADLKTRASRFERVRREVKAGDAQVLAISEYLHPRLQEVCETLPAAWGRWLLASNAPRRLVERFTGHGRVVRTSSLGGYLLLYATAGLRRWRRKSLRHAHETTAIEAWLGRIHRAAPVDAGLALEIARCQRLVKGYGDTLERGRRNFQAVMSAADRLAGAGAAEAVRELHEAALADEHGQRLQATLAARGLA